MVRNLEAAVSLYLHSNADIGWRYVGTPTEPLAQPRWFGLDHKRKTSRPVVAFGVSSRMRTYSL
jgi:hypothetical protein